MEPEADRPGGGHLVVEPGEDAATVSLLMKRLAGRQAAGGVELHVDMVEHAAMGIIPVLKKLPFFLRSIRDTADRIVSGGADVVLTQGFVVADEVGDTCLLGRGGSDTSGALFARMLEAGALEIWTDVPGIFSADPNVVPGARLLRRLSYSEAQEFAAMGAGGAGPGLATDGVRDRLENLEQSHQEQYQELDEELNQPSSASSESREKSSPISEAGVPG